MLDVDHFKQVNDQLGHPAGDAALVRVGEVIGDSARETDLPARAGGEEFAVIAPGTDASSALNLAERIRRQVAVVFADAQVPITVSVGLADSSPEEPVDATEIQRRADRALYAAKGNGRDRVERFSAALLVEAVS